MSLAQRVIRRLSLPAFVPVLAAILLSGCAMRRPGSGPTRQTAAPSANPYLQDAGHAVEALQAWYIPDTGLYRTTGWWNSANAITVLVDYERVSRSTRYNGVIGNTFSAAQKTSPGFLNKFYDDEGWWALAWIDAYDLTNDQNYLSMAESIFADMAASWDNTCGGGIWWSKDKGYKNAIANELFLSVAAHLASRTSGSERKRYLAWSRREWQWFDASGMVNSDNLVNDGLRKAGETGPSCTNNGRTTWTYNQGVILGGLAELSMTTRNPALMAAADRIATSAISRLADGNGILHDPCEPKCGADGVQFKGIFIRNLALLDRYRHQAQYEAFIDKNADTLWNSAQGSGYQLSERWSGPFDSSNAAAQTSGLDALIAAATLQNRPEAGIAAGR